MATLSIRGLDDKTAKILKDRTPQQGVNLRWSD
jgi:hypothetical protein